MFKVSCMGNGCFGSGGGSSSTTRASICCSVRLSIDHGQLFIYFRLQKEEAIVRIQNREKLLLRRLRLLLYFRRQPTFEAEGGGEPFAAGGSGVVDFWPPLVFLAPFLPPEGLEPAILHLFLNVE
jgi:hypothetical protein